jgi:hypothetical protein
MWNAFGFRSLTAEIFAMVASNLSLILLALSRNIVGGRIAVCAEIEFFKSNQAFVDNVSTDVCDIRRSWDVVNQVIKTTANGTPNSAPVSELKKFAP